MAQRINPNILKLNISKGALNNSHYLDLSKNNNLLEKFHEDLYLQNFLEGFFFIFNFYTSEIIVNRKDNKIFFNFLLFNGNLHPKISSTNSYNKHLKDSSWGVSEFKYENHLFFF